MNKDKNKERIIVEDCKKLSIYALNKAGLFREKNNITRVIINYANHDQIIVTAYPEHTSLDIEYYNHRSSFSSNYNIRLMKRRCYYGGVRYYFICPSKDNFEDCNRPSGVLYLPPNNKYFACRQCHKLIYRQQKEHNKSDDKFEPCRKQIEIDKLLATGKEKDRKKAFKLKSRRDKLFEKYRPGLERFLGRRFD